MPGPSGTIVKFSWLVPDKDGGGKARKEFEIELRKPKSVTYAAECVGHAQMNPFRGLAACLAVAWLAGPSRGAPKTRLERCAYNVNVFGGKVLDELVGRGARISEVHAAGSVAMDLLAEMMIPEDEVAAMETFTEVEDSSTG